MFAKPLCDTVGIAAGTEPEQLLVLCAQQLSTVVDLTLRDEHLGLTLAGEHDVVRARQRAPGARRPIVRRRGARRGLRPRRAAGHGRRRARREARAPYGHAVPWRAGRPGVLAALRSPTARCASIRAGTRSVAQTQMPFLRTVSIGSFVICNARAAVSVRQPQPGQRGGGLHRVVDRAETGGLLKDQPELLLRGAPPTGCGCQPGGEPDAAEVVRRPVPVGIGECRALARRDPPTGR